MYMKYQTVYGRMKEERGKMILELGESCIFFFFFFF